MKKTKRLLALLLAAVLLLGVLPLQAAAASGDAVSTGETIGLTQFSLSVDPLETAGPVKAETGFGFLDNTKVKAPVYEYTFTVPSGTKSVTLSLTSSAEENGFFIESENDTMKVSDFLTQSAKPADLGKSLTVTLSGGVGATKYILPYIPSSTSGEVVNAWSANKTKIFRFHFIEASAPAEPVTIQTGQEKGLTQFTLSPGPLNPDDSALATPFTLQSGQAVKDWLHIYTYTVPAGTKSVTISLTSSDPKNGFFTEAENGALSFDDCVRLKSKPENTFTEITVPLTNGKGSTKCILPYLVGNYEGYPDNPTKVYTWTLNWSKLYQFCFVEASDSVTITENLPVRAVYQLGDSVTTPLRITASAPSGSNITYTWYRGATPETITTVIDGAATNEYTPATTEAGVTYYRVVATVTEEGKDPVELRSATTKFVVKDPKVQFSLQTYMLRELQTIEGSERIYTLKNKLNGTTERWLLNVSAGKLTGTIPDGVKIERVWSGSAADELDLSREGALTVDYDTNTFSIDLNKAQSRESAYLAKDSVAEVIYFHLLGRCLYLQTSDGIYTIAADSESANITYAEYLPETVALVGEDGKALPDFQVETAVSETPEGILEGIPEGSVYQKTLTSDTPAVLRALVKNRGEVEGKEVNAETRANCWKQTQENWVLVNGQPVGGSFHGQTDAADGTSDAFTLKPGWNVVEVYTNLRPYYLQNDSSVEFPGMRAKGFYAFEGQAYFYKSVVDTSVVYLINYQGASATSLPQNDQTDTSLQEVQVLRFGVTNSTIQACPLRKTGDGYELTVPQAFDTNGGEKTVYNEYTHAVLMAATPKVPGATATFSGADGLVVGESVADGAFLNMEALYGKDKSFIITVTAADGETQKTYPVKVVYASSVTKAEITVSGAAKLDVDFDENTYTYYLDYYDKLATAGFLKVALPAGATATVNGGEAFSGEKLINTSAKWDFFRLTITAADGMTEKTYYFVTRYEKTGEIPYTTVSQESKDLAKEMLWKYQETLESKTTFSSYWEVFRAKAATGAEGIADYNFDGKYVENPARHTMKYRTDWSACILEIVMLGYNPYDFPYYEDGVLNEHFDYVNALKTRDPGGAFANAVWYQFALKTIGDPITGKLSMEQGFALNKDYSWLDIRAWAIASLAGSEPKDMVRYVDTLRNEQVKQGEFKGLWDQVEFEGSGTNPNTVGCVLSAIAAAGTDPDKQFVYDGVKPLEAIKENLYREDGLFYAGKNSTQRGELSKDIVIGLGDVMHGSNVWDRYALTAEKYNALIEKAKKEKIDTSAMPEFKEKDDASSRAYFALYQKVADAREAKGDTSMRAKVIWGMPYELFTDSVNAMPEASDFTAENLKDLEALIQQYEELDDANKSAVARSVMNKYQALVTKGLACKAKQEGVSAKAAELYPQILELPKAGSVTAENCDEVQAAVDAIRGAMTKTEERLLQWAGASVLEKLAAVEDALAKLDGGAADKAAAAKVTEAIDALPAADKITLENKEAVAAARAAFDALTEAQQALVSKEAQDKLAACEARIAELEKPDEPIELPFTDLTQDWYMDSIRYVYEHELMYGTTDTTFAPDDALTRGMFVTMLYRMEGKPEATGNTSFTDVPANMYYADAVAWASANGVVYGTSETAFSPDGKITREQMAAMMRRYASFKKLDTSARADLSGYTDAATVSSWASDDMKWAVASELLYGNTRNQLQPTANATRAQAAAILQRFATKIVK